MDETFKNIAIIHFNNRTSKRERERERERVVNIQDTTHLEKRNQSAKMSTNQTTPSQPPRVAAAEQKLLWTCVARATIPFSVHTGGQQDVPNTSASTSNFKDAPVLILAEAGEDPFGNGLVAQTARELLQKRATAGWEYHNSSNGGGMMNNLFWNKNASNNNNNNNNNKSSQQQQQQQQNQQQQNQQPQPLPRLKGIKFHLYDNSAACLHDKDNNNNSTNTGNGGGCHNEMLLWVFCAVYNPATIEQNAVKSFIEKMIVLTELYRDTDEVWRQGTTLSCQASFAPILQQRMQEVSYMHNGEKLALLQHQLDVTKSVMHDNIQLILQREEQLHELNERTTRLQDMALDFKKRSKGVRQKMMWQNARHGVMLGGAISAGVAIVVVPPLVALL
jgi:Synaptobrevin